MDKREFMELMLGMSLSLRKWAPDFADQATLRAWYQLLGDIDGDTLRKACKLAVTTLDEFPSPAKIIRMTKGTCLSDEEIGQDIASRIEQAITSHGYTGSKSAEAFIGEIGWEVVRQSGGWVHICDVTTNDMLPSSRKQWRELATVVSKKFHTTGQNIGPALPQGSQVERPPALKAAMDLVMGSKVIGHEMDKEPRTGWDKHLKDHGDKYNPIYEEPEPYNPADNEI